MINVNIISEYGEVLEETSYMAWGVPESKLPYPKEVIKKSILMWYSALQNETFKDVINQDYSEIAEYLLSNKFFESLEGGYVELAKFIPDDEAKLCADYFQLIPKIKQDPQYIHKLKREYIDEYIDRLKRDSDKVVSIQKKIAKETKVYIKELEKLKMD